MYIEDESFLIAQVHELIRKKSWWGNPQTSEERWNQAQGKIEIPDGVQVRCTPPSPNVYDRLDNLPSRVGIKGHLDVSNYKQWNLMVDPAAELRWRNSDAEGRYLLGWNSRGGGSEFGASISGLGLQCAIPTSSGEFKAANGIKWLADDGAIIKHSRVHSFKNYGLHAYNCRRAKLHNVHFLGQNKDPQQGDVFPRFGVRMVKGNLTLDHCDIHRVNHGVSTEGVEQIVTNTLHMEEVNLPFFVTGRCTGFREVGITTIRSAKGPLAKFSSQARVLDFVVNVQNHQDGDGKPDDVAGVEIGGTFEPLILKGASNPNKHATGRFSNWGNLGLEELYERMDILETMLKTHTHPGGNTGQPSV